MSVCRICQQRSRLVSQAVGVCKQCILADSEAARCILAEAHRRSRTRFALPAVPPRDPTGRRCNRCSNVCRIAPGSTGYCGIRQATDNRITGGDAAGASVSWYYDPLPTNCVADWVCPASTAAGYPQFTDTKGAEHGYYNLAVFYEACSFDCLFCQNWHFKDRQFGQATRSATDLARAVTDRTRCICFFGGDPACQIEHALAAAEYALQACKGKILRICWETNGSVARQDLKQMLQLSLASGGCIKFDLKAWDECLHRALCGVSNRRTLKNFAFASRLVAERRDPPLLVAATLLVPGYVEADQVSKIAQFIARLDPDIPYALLAFHPDFEMIDLPATSRQQALECLAAARQAGLTRVRIGNQHLLH